MLAVISSYIKTHERLIIILALIIASWFIVGRVENVIANHDKANLTSQQAVLQSQVEKNAALAVQVQTQATQYQALAEKVQAQNSALEQANVALAAALTKQQKTDATLPPTELTQRWNTLVPNAGISIINGQITVPSTGAVATVQQLELIPVQQENLISAQTEIKNDESLISASNASIDTLNLRISGLNTQLVDSQKVCSAQVASVKAANHKANRRWFVIGLISGLAAHFIVAK